MSAVLSLLMPPSTPDPAQSPGSKREKNEPQPKKRRGRRLPHLLPDSVPGAILAAATRARDRLLVQLPLYCGLRVAELVALRVDDLELDRLTIQVREGKGSKDRAQPVPMWLAGELAAYVAALPRPLFADALPRWVFPGRRRGGHLTPKAARGAIKRLAAAAGLPDPYAPRKYHPHALRHCYGTALLRAGADIREVQELLGHSSVATTTIYLHACPDRLRAAVDRLPHTAPAPVAPDPADGLLAGLESVQLAPEQ